MTDKVIAQRSAAEERGRRRDEGGNRKKKRSPRELNLEKKEINRGNKTTRAERTGK